MGRCGPARVPTVPVVPYDDDWVPPARLRRGRGRASLLQRALQEVETVLAPEDFTGDDVARRAENLTLDRLLRIGLVRRLRFGFTHAQCGALEPRGGDDLIERRGVRAIALLGPAAFENA